MKHEFLVKSSGTEPYLVAFNFSDGKLSITCNCKAGIFHQLCKHKLALLQGDSAMLHDSSSEPDLRKLQELISSTSYPELLQEIHQATVQADEAKKHLSKTKKLLGKAMKEGA